MEIRSIASFSSYWQRIHGRTRRVIACIPEDAIEWTCRRGSWTLGDLVRHLAALERYMFVENACGRPSAYAGHDRRLAAGYGDVLDFYDRLHRESVALIEGLPDARLHERCVTPGGAELAVWKWLRAMLEHEIHHRGQIYLYLRLLGVASPPLFGLTAEQVQARSQAPP
ncbi:MAG: DUF664 domain-containing protein [Acidobacteria bacterium]|nr:MAG: DUF664 domain-containing protein [Acidobacteriota bacterium]